MWNALLCWNRSIFVVAVVCPFSNHEFISQNHRRHTAFADYSLKWQLLKICFFYSIHKIFIRFIRFWFATTFFCFVFNHFNFVLSYSFVVFCAFFFCSLKFFCESNGIENEWQIVGRLRRWMRSEIFISIILIGVVYNDYITCSLEPENRQQTPKQSTRNSECGCVCCALVGFTFVFYFY